MTFAMHTHTLQTNALIAGALEKTCCRCGRGFLDYSQEGRGRVCAACKRPRSIHMDSLKELCGKPLTQRERQIADLISKGKRNKDIAELLHVGEGTIKTYVSKILANTGANNRTELAVQWIRHAGEPVTDDQALMQISFGGSTVLDVPFTPLATGNQQAHK